MRVEDDRGSTWSLSAVREAVYSTPTRSRVTVFAFPSAFRPPSHWKELWQVASARLDHTYSSTIDHQSYCWSMNPPRGSERKIRKVCFAHVQFAEPCLSPCPCPVATGGLCLFRPRLRGLVVPCLLRHLRLFEREYSVVMRERCHFIDVARNHIHMSWPAGTFDECGSACARERRLAACAHMPYENWHEAALYGCIGGERAGQRRHRQGWAGAARIGVPAPCVRGGAHRHCSGSRVSDQGTPGSANNALVFTAEAVRAHAANDGRCARCGVRAAPDNAAAVSCPPSGHCAPSKLHRTTPRWRRARLQNGAYRVADTRAARVRPQAERGWSAFYARGARGLHGRGPVVALA
jgi:hypothetical protein